MDLFSIEYFICVLITIGLVIFCVVAPDLMHTLYLIFIVLASMFLCSATLLLIYKLLTSDY